MMQPLQPLDQNMDPASVDVIWISRKPAPVFEQAFCHDFCRKTTKSLLEQQGIVNQWIDADAGQMFGPLLEAVTAPRVLIVTRPELVVSPHAALCMIQTLLSGALACFPVYNDTRVLSQAACLPATYLSLSSYLEVAKIMADRSTQKAGQTSFPDLSCAMFDSRILDQAKMAALEADQNPVALISECTAPDNAVVDPDALVHSFGTYGRGQRPELLRLVPETAGSLLDVGCAWGDFGKMVRKNQPETALTGIEMNPVMAEAAARYYDNMYTQTLESIAFEERFDHINCGDIMEHLYDPWQMLDVFYEILTPGGTLVLSLPNAGHWTLVKDLARGDFPYLPFGLTCITHIRWFTEKTITDALLTAGFQIRHFFREQVPPTPAGNAFIKGMCEKGWGDETSLSTHQFTLQAVRPA